MQQRVYQMTFRNVYEFKKQLEKSGLVWSRTLSILLSMNGEIVSMPVFAQWANISINLIAGSWKMKQLDKVSAKASKMWTKCVLCVIRPPETAVPVRPYVLQQFFIFNAKCQRSFGRSPRNFASCSEPCSILFLKLKGLPSLPQKTGKRKTR